MTTVETSDRTDVLVRPPSSHRVLHRVTLIGEVPIGPDGRSSELVEGEPFRALPVFDRAQLDLGGRLVDSLR